MYELLGCPVSPSTPLHVAALTAGARVPGGRAMPRFVGWVVWCNQTTLGHRRRRTNASVQQVTLGGLLAISRAADVLLPTMYRLGTYLLARVWGAGFSQGLWVTCAQLVAQHAH